MLTENNIISNMNVLGDVGSNILREISLLKDKRFISDQSYNNYLKFCCDVGALDLVYFTFECMDKNSVRLEEFKISCPNILRIQEFSKDSFILNLQLKGVEEYKLGDDLYVKNEFISYFNTLKNKESTSKENMILNYLLVLVLRIQQKILTGQECIELFNYFYSVKNVNSTRRYVCILLLIEYCITYQIDEFFKLPYKFYNHISKVLQQLVHNSILDTESTRDIIKLTLDKLRKYNSFQTSTKKRVAICISGLYRNHKEALRSIKENLVDPLNADVFIHTWEDMSVWSGFGGSPHYLRVFGQDLSKILPSDYHWLTKLESIFPMTYSILSIPISQKINSEDVFSMLTPKKVSIESENIFIESLGALTGYTRLRGSSNQIKMFHGMKQSFDMALENRTYDYIIRCRPDVLIKEAIDSNIFNKLINNTIYTGVVPQGLVDGLFIISSSMAYNFSQFVDLMYEKNELSPFDAFPEYDSHNLLGAWMLANNYTYDKEIIKGHILVNPQITIPGLKDALESDYSKLNDVDKEKFKDFVEYLIKRNG